MNNREVYTTFFLLVFLLLFCTILLRIPAVTPPRPIVPAPAGIVLWKDRIFDVILQGFLILSGVVSVLLLLVFRVRKEEGL